jgi:acetyltransferase-like isoleucine patch superfamily enzyme
MLFHPFLSGIYLPFKIWHIAGLKIRSGVEIKLGGRITLGNPDKNSAVVSRLPINIYFGKRSKINIGHSLSVGPGVNIIVKDDASLTIGNNTYFTSDMHLEVVNSVQIGDSCAISWGVTIIDDDHHEIISGVEKKKSKPSSVNIGNKVWIGCNVTILKNTSIGNNCVIAAGSVVKGSFPDNSLIAGNPAMVVKQNINWK